MMIPGLVSLALAGTVVAAASGSGAGPSVVRSQVEQLRKAADENPQDARNWNRLAVAQRRLARWTGDHSADDDAWSSIQKALSLDGRNPEALSLKGWIEAGRHDFESAVVSAQRAIEEQPDNSWNYGVLADALTELGRYPEAVKAVEQMMMRKPGVGAYSRAAHLRALHGDREGAIQLMKLAVEASSPSDPEGLAWCRVMLGREYQALGRWDAARAEYDGALSMVSDYHLALFHLAETLAAESRFTDALIKVRTLRQVSPSVAAWALEGEILAAQGREQDASRAFSEVKKTAALADPSKAEPRWLARFYADRGENLEAAIAMVNEELKAHQDIETWDGLAWAHFRNGSVREAKAASEKAMSIGTESARLLVHRGLIEIGSRNESAGVRHLRRALELGDLWPSEKKLAREALRTMRETSANAVAPKRRAEP